MVNFIWSEPAKIDYWSNIDYLEREWTLKEVYNFIDKVDELINLLAKENLVFKSTNFKKHFSGSCFKTNYIVLSY